jgi:hypothetical protein
MVLVKCAVKFIMSVYEIDPGHFVGLVIAEVTVSMTFDLTFFRFHFAVSQDFSTSPYQSAICRQHIEQ